ncbi:MAG: hypothetical protein O2999_11285 [Nitrospirae bacterium]|nr:hypothetical protein [Nitrospirota bacterium]
MQKTTKQTIQFIIYFIIAFTSLAHGELPGPYLGFITDTDSRQKYNLTFNFGVEQWENDKRAEKMNERWLLQCVYPDNLAKNVSTWCHLDRTKFMQFGDEVFASSHDHYVSDGTLKLMDVDWERGILDLSVVHKDKTTTEVKIRMTIQNQSIYLDSFEAFAISRGLFPDSPMTVIEFRIPKYTYTLNVPIKMLGLRSEEDKKLEDMVASLSQQDQKAWEKFKN